MREYLGWRANQHRRQQARKAEEVVMEWMTTNFPLLEVPSWDMLAGSVGLLRNNLAGKPTLNTDTECKVVFLMDFNCLGARDVLRMGQMLQAAGTMGKMFGPSNCAVMAWMPNCGKEDSDATAFDDEITIANSLSKAGFRKQLRIRMLLDMPVCIAQKVSAIDWFVDGRLCFLEGQSNEWESSSELSRTRTVREVPKVPEASELREAVSLNADEELSTTVRYMDVPEKCAQRGLAASKAQLKALLTPSARLGKPDWLQKDQVLIFDFHAHVGDRTMASYELRKELNLPNLRHIICGVGQGNHLRSARYTATRLRNRVAEDWLSNALVLTTKKTLPSGVIVDQEVRPVDEPPPPTEAELSNIPGALRAHRGMGKLELRVCMVSGNKITIRPDKLAQFASVSPESASKLEELVSTHNDKYMRALSSMDVPGEVTAMAVLDDGRNMDVDPVNSDSDQSKFLEYESLESLRAVATITGECRSACKSVHILRDESKTMCYVISKSEDVILTPGMAIGAVGGGTFLDRDEDRVKAIPWELPLGDQTWAQLERRKVKGERDVEDDDAPKFVSGTLCAVARQIERKSTKGLKLTSFGDLIPVTEAGLQKYKFSSPEGADNHRKLDFVLSTPKVGSKVSHGNFFAPFVSRANGLGKGGFQITFRLIHDPVGNCLKVHRVAVTVAQRIVLTKGKPLRVLWPDESTGATSVAAEPAGAEP